MKPYSKEEICPGCGVVISYLHSHECPYIKPKAANTHQATCKLCGLTVGHKVECPNYDELYNHKSKLDPVPIGLSRQKAADLLQHASELINGERAKDYGEPQQSFEKIAKLWSIYLHYEITVTDVGMLMILLKVARNGRGRNKPDNFVDICGYASLVGSEFFEAKDKKE